MKNTMDHKTRLLTRTLATLALVLPLGMIQTACSQVKSTYWIQEAPLGSRLPRLQGNFIDDRYYDGSGAFSIVVKESDRKQIKEDVNPHLNISSTIFGSFVDECSSVRVETYKDFPEFELLRCYPKAAGEFLQKLFNDVCVPAERKGCPKVEVMHEEILEGSSTAFFGIVKRPNGSHCLNYGTKQYVDQLIGYYLFLDCQQMVVLTVERPDYRWIKDPVQIVRELLIEMHSSYRNESINEPLCNDE